MRKLLISVYRIIVFYVYKCLKVFTYLWFYPHIKKNVLIISEILFDITIKFLTKTKIELDTTTLDHAFWIQYNTI